MSRPRSSPSKSRLRGLILAAASAALVALALPLTAQSQEGECEWLAGDFHVHTIYSHDVWSGPGDDNTGNDEFYTFGWTPGQQGAIAESRDLDFIAITDHDRVTGELEPGVSGWGLQNQLPGGDPLIWVPNYENTINYPNAQPGEPQPGDGGHAQMHGAIAEKFNIYESLDGPLEAAEEIRADGGAFQINHPSDAKWHTWTDKNDDGKPVYDEFTYDLPGFAPDALEVWNIGVWFYEPPMPATNDHEFTPLMYNDFLDDGFQVAATGGSDNHWRSTTAVQGVGQPTTWVCVDPENRNADGIVDGVKANRTTISHQPPAYMGALANLFADEANDQDDEFESMIGDTVTPGSRIRAEVDNAVGATLRFVTNGGEILAQETVTSFNYTSDAHTVPTESTWVRSEVFYEDGREARSQLQDLCAASDEIFGGDEPDEMNTYCHNRLAMVAMTSPIYFEAPDLDPETTLTYDGDTEVKVGSNATLAATLLDSTGAPLAGQTVTFTFRDSTLSATTDDTGRASVQVRVQGPPGNYDVVSDFAGTDTYDASHDHDLIAVTSGAR